MNGSKKPVPTPALRFSFSPPAPVRRAHRLPRLLQVLPGGLASLLRLLLAGQHLRVWDGVGLRSGSCTRWRYEPAIKMSTSGIAEVRQRPVGEGPLGNRAPELELRKQGPCSGHKLYNQPDSLLSRPPAPRTSCAASSFCLTTLLHSASSSSILSLSLAAIHR